MLEIEGEVYYIDYAKLTAFLYSGEQAHKGGIVTETDTKEFYGAQGELISKEVNTRKYPRDKTVDPFRYQTILDMISIVLDLESESDSLGREDLTKRNIGFKVAFNTLLEYQILNTVPEEE